MMEKLELLNVLITWYKNKKIYFFNYYFFRNIDCINKYYIVNDNNAIDISPIFHSLIPNK